MAAGKGMLKINSSWQALNIWYKRITGSIICSSPSYSMALHIQINRLLQYKGLDDSYGATSLDGWHFICMIKWLWPQFHLWNPIFHQNLTIALTSSVNSPFEWFSMTSWCYIYAYAFQFVEGKFKALYYRLPLC